MKTEGKNIRKERPQLDDGFTIVEIVIVMILIMLAIFPMMRAMASAMEASNDEQYITHCAFLAQMKMEEVRLKSLCYSDRNDCGGFPLESCCFIGGNDDSDFESGLGLGGFDEGPGACGFHAGFANYKCQVVDKLIKAPGQCMNQGNCLKAVRVYVWYDKNGNNALDTGEPNVLLESYLTVRFPI